MLSAERRPRNIVQRSFTGASRDRNKARHDRDVNTRRRADVVDFGRFLRSPRRAEQLRVAES